MGRAKPKPLLAELTKLGDPVARSAISPDLRAFSASCSSRKDLTVNLALLPSTATRPSGFRSFSGCEIGASGLREPWESSLPIADSELNIPATMHAAVYRGQSVVNVEQIPTPAIRPGEILIRVEACGICHTALKKIEHNLLSPPRVYGHETAGVVLA